MPFEVPEGWCWGNLLNVCHIFGRIGFRGYTKEDLVAYDGAITLSPSNIIDGKMNYNTCTYISWNKYDESPEIQIQDNDILLVKTGSSYGKCALVEKLPKQATINPQFVVLKHISCNPEYLTYVLQSKYAQYNYEKFVLGTAIPTFTQVALGNMQIPIPPLSEQNRIVTEIKRLLAIIESLENNQRHLKEVLALSKSKILEIALSGKLIPENSNDEPAIELLTKINPAYKSCDNRHYENVPFDLPKTWQLTKLKDLCVFLSRGKSPKYSETDKTYPVFAQKCNLKDGGISLEHARFLDPTTVSKWKDVYKLQDGDILINSTGTGTVCRTRLFKTRYLNNYPFVVPDSHVSVIRLHKLISPEYAYIVLSSNASQSYMMDNLAGSTNQKELYISVLENLIFPVPPIEEQRRIVYIVKKISEYIDKIAAAL